MKATFAPGSSLALSAGLLLLAGCESSGGGSDASSERPMLAAFNAVADLPEITFLREEEVWSSLEFGEATEHRSVDADQYDVRFDTLLPGDETSACSGDLDRDGVKDDDECTRLTSVSVNVLNDHEYIVALLGRHGDLSVEVYDKPFHRFDTEDTSVDGDPEDRNMEVQIFHWSATLGPIDVYLEPPGTNLSPSQFRATLELGDEFHGLVDEGDYVLSLTAVGDPSSPVYTSETFTLSRQTRVGLAVLDGTTSVTSAIRVSRFRDQGGDLLDRRVRTELRLTHVATGVGNVDVFAEENYSEPFVAGLAYGGTSEYLTVDPTDIAALQLDVTPAGNPGALLAREHTSLTKGSRSTFFLVTSGVGNVDGLRVQDRFQRFAPYASIRLLNSTAKSLDFYVIPHGNNVFTSTPSETLSPGSSGQLHLMDPGSYDLWTAPVGTDLYSFGPLNVELSARGAFTVVAVPTADVTRTDVVLLDDFAE